MSKISANERAGWHVRFNAIMPTYTARQPKDMNAVCDLLGCTLLFVLLLRLDLDRHSNLCITLNTAYY